MIDDPVAVSEDQMEARAAGFDSWTRNLVKKAVNWALRQIGKRKLALTGGRSRSRSVSATAAGPAGR